MAFVLSAFFAYNAFASGRIGSSTSAGQIVYEADANGRLQRVTRPTIASTPAPPFWKPETTLLLENSKTLDLSQDQRKRIEVVNRAWIAEKAALQSAIERAFVQGTGGQKTRKEGGAIPAAVLTKGLEGYSDLSSLYNNRRESYWAQATAVLTKAQLDKLEALRKEGRT